MRVLTSRSSALSTKSESSTELERITFEGVASSLDFPAFECAINSLTMGFSLSSARNNRSAAGVKDPAASWKAASSHTESDARSSS